jgi:hypothetical protein
MKKRDFVRELFKLDFYWPIQFRKLYNPDSLLYRIELWIGYHCIPLSGFWFDRWKIK